MFGIIILGLPLLMFVVLGLCGNRMQGQAAGVVATCSMAVVTGLALWLGLGSAQERLFNVEWLRLTDTLSINIGFEVDSLSKIMLIVVTSVSLLVHLYSLGYMKGERGFARYYAFLSLFTFAMLGLVASTNIFQMYIFWELVGASSYLLIGFYYEKPSAVLAAKKAFIVTRFADAGFLIGILLVSYYTGTFDFAVLNTTGAAVMSSTGGTFLGLASAVWAGAFIFMGAAGKSAMFPLHIWLPSAMEGPTPVSALIHAATMVVAGIYLVARLIGFYTIAAADVLGVMQWVGGFTALFAAIIATKQTDIKRVLAFSTISQIAYMFCALGTAGGYEGSVFHLFTHAFFKALLFLGAGVVIHAVHSNEMSAMGNLARRMPITHATFLIACLAIAGIPPFSGFFSKDMILGAAWHSSPMLFWTLWLTAGLTAVYMFRLYFKIFWGKPDKLAGGRRQAAVKKIKTPVTMLIPLILLAILTLVGGFVFPVEEHIDWLIAGLSIGVGVVGIAIAWLMYARGNHTEKEVAIIKNGFGIDRAWIWITKSVIFRFVSQPIAWFDRHIIDGSFNGLGWLTKQGSKGLEPMQGGRVQSYAMFFIGGVLLITIAVLYL